MPSTGMPPGKPIELKSVEYDGYMEMDSNLHREKILPSEKAFAYKLKMDALSHQGTSCQLGTKLRTNETIGESVGESARQVQRYIRLTELIPQILSMVDAGKLP